MSAVPDTAATGRPLAGVTVVDLTTALAGPYATLLLGALGATVIKVENPRTGGDSARNNAPYVGPGGPTLARGGDDDVSVAMLERGRNKLGITLDLKHPRAKEIFADLVRKADAVVENYAAGTADRLGVGYRDAAAANPAVVYVSISGFGASGDRHGLKGMDTIFQALSGLMLVSGAPDDPPLRSGVPFGDMTGPLFAVIGLLAALRARDRTGRGQHVDVSLLGALTSVLATEQFDLLRELGIPTRTGNTVPRLAPFGVFATTDGHLALCAPTDAFARGVFAGLGRPELIEDARFARRDGRVANATALHGLIADWTAARTTADAVAELQRHGVPSAEVRGPGAAVHDPDALARGDTRPLEHPALGRVDGLVGSGLPIRFSEAPEPTFRPPPGLGEHTDEILASLLGYDADTIAALRSDGVV